jgi:hydrogenase-4 component B
MTWLAIPFLAIVGIVSLAVATWNLKRGAPADGLRLSAFAAAMIGVLLARSVFAFLLCWELMSLLSAFLVASDHTRREVRRAAFAYMLVSQLGALCIAAAFSVLAVHAHSGDFTRVTAAAPSLSGPLRLVAISLALLGFGSKAGLVPLQFWLPRAHPAAPANASAMLSGVMLKIAVYGMLLTIYMLAAPSPQSVGIALVLVGAVSALVGALYASIESELKRLLAYSSIENLGIIVAAIGLAVVASAALQPALAALALAAALFHAINHAAFKGLLFLAAGTVAERLHHLTDLDSVGGLASNALRRTAPLVLIGCLAASALPPLNGFASEWLVLRGFIGAFSLGPVGLGLLAIAAVAMLATAGGLGAAAFIKLYGTAFLGRPRHERTAKSPEQIDAAVAGIGILAGMCIVLGIAPMLVLQPLLHVAPQFSGSDSAAIPTLSYLPMLAILPVVGAVLAVTFARVRGVRRVPTWTCGSNVGPRSQYSATVLTKPIRLIFRFAVLPQRQRVIVTEGSRWIPVRISYCISARYVLDELARVVAAFVQRFSRRTRALQGGRLRVYLTYALVTFALMLIVAR